jgi:hypothetical protein
MLKQIQIKRGQLQIGFRMCVIRVRVILKLNCMLSCRIRNKKNDPYKANSLKQVLQNFRWMPCIWLSNKVGCWGWQACGSYGGGGTEIHTGLAGETWRKNLILMDPCIVGYSVEIPTRCSFVIECIIPKFFEGSTRFKRHTAHHQEL